MVIKFRRLHVNVSCWVICVCIHVCEGATEEEDKSSNTVFLDNTKNSKYSYDTRKSFCGHLQYIGTVYWHILQTYTTNL